MRQRNTFKSRDLLRGVTVLRAVHAFFTEQPQRLIVAGCCAKNGMGCKTTDLDAFSFTVFAACEVFYMRLEGHENLEDGVKSTFSHLGGLGTGWSEARNALVVAADRSFRKKPTDKYGEPLRGDTANRMMQCSLKRQLRIVADAIADLESDEL